MKLYFLIDSRAGLLAADTEVGNLNHIDKDWGRYVLLASKSKKEICHEANQGNYGDNCIVADNSGYIYWEWFDGDKWNCKN
jgi:hypothetical protein